MLRLIGLGFKLIFFSVAVLVLGHLIRWDGKTVSDQVRTGLAQAEHATATNQWLPPILSPVRSWASHLLGDARNGSQKSSTSSRSFRDNDDEASPAERRKLQSLIQHSR
ncbi:hypothetical protein WDW86_01980 [Bdellovibrionota bacterium FG-2]